MDKARPSDQARQNTWDDLPSSGGESVFAQPVNIKVNSCISHHLIESIGVLILGLIWFFVSCTISYMINDLLPAYRKSESLGRVWAWMLLEISLTIFLFHQAIRLLIHVSDAIFKDYGQINPLSPVHGAILATFAIIVFQNSLSLRTRRVWISFLGETHQGQVNEED